MSSRTSSGKMHPLALELLEVVVAGQLADVIDEVARREVHLERLAVLWRRDQPLHHLRQPVRNKE